VSLGKFFWGAMGGVLVFGFGGLGGEGAYHFWWVDGVGDVEGGEWVWWRGMVDVWGCGGLCDVLVVERFLEGVFWGWLPCEMTGAIVVYVSELELEYVLPTITLSKFTLLSFRAGRWVC
jgi:hypothetical protein